MRGGQRQQKLLVQPRFDIMHVRVRHIAACVVVHFVDKGALDHMVAAAFGFLAEGARAVQTFDAQLEHEHILIHQRGLVDV